MTWLLKTCFVLPLFRMSHGASASHAELLQLASSRASSRALSGFQKYTDGLVDEYMRTGKKVDDNVKEAIKIITEFIMQEYKDNLGLHNDDKTGQTDCTKNVEECTTQWFSEIHLQHVKNLTTLIDRERDEHDKCRRNQHTCCDEMSVACKKYHNYRKIESDVFPDCYDPDLSQEFIKTQDTEDRQTMETCLEAVHAWHRPLYALYKACDDKRLCCWDNPDSTCKEHQKEFEYAHCVGYDYINDHCEGHRDCWDNHTAKCDSTYCPALQKRVEVRKAENETGLRIICLLDVLVGEDDSKKREELEACKDETYEEEQQFWNIECPAGGFPPEWPPALEGICQTPPEKHVNVWVPCSQGHFAWIEYRPHTLAGEWETVQCKWECPGHYAGNFTHQNQITVRNTTFEIPHDGDGVIGGGY